METIFYATDRQDRAAEWCVAVQAFRAGGETDQDLKMGVGEDAELGGC